MSNRDSFNRAYRALIFLAGLIFGTLFANTSIVYVALGAAVAITIYGFFLVYSEVRLKE